MRRTRSRDLQRLRRMVSRGEPACYLCGDPIDYSAPFPEPMSFVIDHVIPVARGGTDSLDNVRPAHQYCNNVKRDKPYAPGIVNRPKVLNY